MNMLLTARNVNTIFNSCLYGEGEETSNAIKVRGITCGVGFHPIRIEENKQEIKELLMQLDPTFRSSELGGGGGWSFLNACMTATGHYWGEHVNMQELFMLGMAAGLVKECLPSEFWSALPGGMPYYEIVKGE